VPAVVQAAGAGCDAHAQPLIDARCADRVSTPHTSHAHAEAGIQIDPPGKPLPRCQPFANATAIWVTFGL
jgi:hypothetical protein